MSHVVCPGHNQTVVDWPVDTWIILKHVHIHIDEECDGERERERESVCVCVCACWGAGEGVSMSWEHNLLSLVVSLKMVTILVLVRFARGR